MIPRPADVLGGLWDRLADLAKIESGSRRAAAFGSFGEETSICFPPVALFGERAIHIGRETVVGPNCSLTVGLGPEQALISDRILVIGDRCVIGRGSSIAAHFAIEIGDDVYFGPNVYVSDQNHANDDPNLPVGRQLQPERPIVIGAGSWLGTGVVVTPGVTIGERVTVGANAVVTADLPSGCRAVGVPARPLE